MRNYQVFFLLSAALAGKSEHYEERCFASGLDKECRLVCLKTFLHQMRDRTTIVAENKEKLKICKSKCYNTPECQKTTTQKPTTKRTTTSKYPMIFKHTYGSGLVSIYDNYSCRQAHPAKTVYMGSAEGRIRQTCRETKMDTGSRQKSGGRYYRKYTCYFECTRVLIS